MITVTVPAAETFGSRRLSAVERKRISRIVNIKDGPLTSVDTATTSQSRAFRVMLQITYS